ncbi:MAG TPA: pyridoxal phosphate-dependent aminotransferase [Mogibacterium sp.]|nr:pyridoxal phosphate-dependent aminotransferase [Mogibacterium sp.]
MPKLSKRVTSFTDSVIRRMTRISDEFDAINLSQGFPDFDPPREILDALAHVAYSGPHQYPITFGAENLRQALACKQGKAIGRTIDLEAEIVITCGATEAMMCAIMTICNPGDKVMIFSPFYENYGADTILTGAQPIYIPLVPPDFSFDLDLIENGFIEGAKAIIVCNPSNPSGKVFTREELESIGRLALKYDAFVITDEVYEHMVYAPYKHTYISGLPGMYDNTITCNSLSKTFSITGWRLGYLIGPPEVIEGAKKVHDFLTVGAPAPLQEAAVPGSSFFNEEVNHLIRLHFAREEGTLDESLRRLAKLKELL